MNIAEIKERDIANGEGFRVSVFVSGCSLACKGCFNEEAWNRNFGYEYNQEILNKIINAGKPDYISGLTLLGGDPMETYNQKGVLEIVETFKEKFPGKNIRLYTGRLLDYHLKPDGDNYIPNVTDKILSYVDVLIDGPYVEVLRDSTLKYRGSSNQRMFVKDLENNFTERIL